MISQLQIERGLGRRKLNLIGNFDSKKVYLGMRRNSQISSLSSSQEEVQSTQGVPQRLQELRDRLKNLKG